MLNNYLVIDFDDIKNKEAFIKVLKEENVGHILMDKSRINELYELVRRAI